MEVLKKLKKELPHDIAPLLLGVYPEKIIIIKDTCTPMFTAALFIIAKTWKPINRGMNKKDVISYLKAFCDKVEVIF